IGFVLPVPARAIVAVPALGEELLRLNALSLRPLRHLSIVLHDVAPVQASPPFPATYETFRNYCVKHGLSKLRSGPILGSPVVSETEIARPSTASPPSTKARPSPTVWPRVVGKPPEFIPRTEDD
ncbi:MAG: hypothetical protein ACN4G0_17720, partial [Polyangiales bacterium]